MKIGFHSYVNKTNFHMKSFTLLASLITRFTATRKWPIETSSPIYRPLSNNPCTTMRYTQDLINNLIDQLIFLFLLSSYQYLLQKIWKTKNSKKKSERMRWRHTLTVLSLPASFAEAFECIVIHINASSFVLAWIGGTHVLNYAKQARHSQ